MTWTPETNIKGPPNVLTIGDVETLPPGSPATAEITGTTPAQTLNLGIPEGVPGASVTFKGTVPTFDDLPDDAEPGDMYNTEDDGHSWVWDGTTWIDGGSSRGADGPPNVLTIGTVTTSAPGAPADANITGTSPAQVLNLTIPRGIQGPPGEDGASDWADITGKPATFPPTLPIPSSGVTGLDAAQAAQDAAIALKADKTYVDTADALLAPKASPIFTGNPTAPTPTAGDNDTSVATTAFVTAADAVATATGAYATKASIVDADNLSGFDSAASNAKSKWTWATIRTALATFFQPLLNNVGIIELSSGLTGDRYSGIDFHSASGGSDFEARLLRSPGVNGAFDLVNTGTGGVRAPTPAAGSNDTQIATTAFVKSEGGIVQPTAAKTTNGVLTALEWTGIPAGVKRITIEFWNISGATTAVPYFLLGDSGGYEASNYVSTGGYIQNTAASSTMSIATGMLAGGGSYNAATVSYGTVILSNLDTATGAIWFAMMTGTVGSVPIYAGSAKALDGRLDRISFRLTDNSAFDASGSVNLHYEM